MTRRKETKNVKVLEKLVQQKEQPSKSFVEASEEFFKHCRIKGLSPDTVKFYQKELKGLFRALIEIEVQLKDVKTLKTQDVESWVEFMLEQK
ncbi:site-specific integrase [Cytobacillus horneckiae]|uniref:site-specific integrase n=1 Tax=Cytobacillus horneckiae TaxID=549687 RepID=UPI003D9A931D